MPRKARRVSPSGFYHVIIRGINKELIFLRREDSFFVLHWSAKIFREHRVGLVAYCIMGNHIHFLLNGDLGDISHSMKRITLTYAMRYNRNNKRTGHVFQNRFMSEPIDRHSYLLNALRYIHNNPVKAGMVSSPAMYLWSSYRAYAYSDTSINVGSSYIPRAEKDYIMAAFDNNLEQFQLFHKELDLRRYFDIHEDTEKADRHHVSMIIRKYASLYNISSADQVKDHAGLTETVVRDLLNQTDISIATISRLLGVSKKIVFGIKKRASAEAQSPNILPGITSPDSLSLVSG